MAMALGFPLRPAGDRERLGQVSAQLQGLMLQPEGIGAGNQPQLQWRLGCCIALPVINLKLSRPSPLLGPLRCETRFGSLL